MMEQHNKLLLELERRLGGDSDPPAAAPDKPAKKGLFKGKTKGKK
jgi:hypothetical protein